MGIEWFRDLSIIILALVTSLVLIFVAILAYRIYRLLNAIILIVKAASKSAYNTIAMIEELLKPLLSIQALIQGILGGFECITKMFKKESNQGGNVNEQG